MIRFKNLQLSRGSKVLLDGADATLGMNERIALVGRNGCGKSTLFKAIMGEIPLDRGDIELPPVRIGVLAQEAPSGELSALDFVIGGDKAVADALAELKDAEARGDADRVADAHHRLGERDGYSAASRAGTLLHGLGFAPHEHSKPVDAFSGGWKMRLNLARTLMTPADLLLLDEPTNHLDLDAIVWLETWLKRFQGTAIIISHDREFIDGVADAVLHIAHTKLTRYTGGFTAFERAAAEEAARQAKAAREQAQRVAELTRFIERFRAKATKAKQAQSRMKALERMTLISPLQEEGTVSLRFPEIGNSPDPLMVIEDLSAGYPTADGGERVVVRKVFLSLRQGERIGVLGRNGAGKSTLIRTIVGAQPALGGEIRKASSLRIGYFDQQAVESLDPQASPVLHLARLAPQANPQQLRDWMASFGIRGDQAVDPVAPLSGGEKSRVALALLAWGKPHLLVLDEPTNHLDAGAREALTEALAAFEGTLLLVSHDRHLLRATVDRFVIVHDGAMQTFDGDLDDYRAWLADRSASQNQPDTAGASGTTSNNTDGASAISRKEERALEAEQRRQLRDARKPLEQKVRKLEQQMQPLQTRLADLDKLLAEPSTYEDNARAAQLSKEHGTVKEQLDTLEMAWFEAQEALEAITL